MIVCGLVDHPSCWIEIYWIISVNVQCVYVMINYGELFILCNLFWTRQIKFILFQVKTYSYVVTGIRNATNTPKLWFMERSCVNKCENGCIVIGERTKLFSCISCCSVPLCNVMDKCSKIITYNVLYYIVLVSLIFFSHNAFIWKFVYKKCFQNYVAY